MDKLPCNECKGLCCRYFCFEIDEPDDYEEFDDIRWYLCHEGVSVHIDEDGDWYIQIDNPCKMLDEGYRCRIYEDRPLICRKYGEDCEYTGNDYCYREEFKTPEDIEKYAKKVLGDKKFEKEKVKHLAKSEGVPKKEINRRLLKAGLMSAGKEKGNDKKRGGN